jgi:hypothetical protein
MRIRSLVLSALGASSLVLLGWGLRPGVEVPQAQPISRAPASSSPAPAVPDSVEDTAPAVVSKRIALWPEQGERWIYRFERKAMAEFGGRPWLSLKLGGRAAVEWVGAYGDHRFFLLTFETDRFEMQGESKAGKKTFPQVRIEIDGAGKFREMRWADLEGAKGLEPRTEEEADFVKDLASQWLFFEESTRMGRAEVEWTENASSPTLISVSKRIVSYPERKEISRLDSNHEWVAGVQDGMAKVERLEGSESFSLRSQSGDFNQQTSYRWLWTNTERLTKPLALRGVGGTLNLADTRGVGKSEDKPFRINVASFDRQWAELSNMAPHARLRFFQEAKKAMDAGQTELVSAILRGVKGKKSMSIEWRTGIGVLAASSNPEAQKALLSLYREGSRAQDEKLSILAGVTAGEGSPVPEWKGVLENEIAAAPPVIAPPAGNASIVTHDEAAVLREASLYALGSALRKTEDPDARQELATLLWKEIKDARSEPARVAVLEAIGNSGNTEYLSYVQEQAGAESPRVRARAIGAVRFFAPEVARPLIEAGKSDPHPSVRKAAVWSEGFFDQDDVESSASE